MPQVINLLIIDPQTHHVLAIKRSKTDRYFPNMWALPGGKIEVGETPQMTAVRELKEETGLIINRFDAKTLLTEDLKIDSKKATILIHEAFVKKGKLSPTDPEITKVKWITPDDLISSLIMHHYPRPQIQKISQLLTERTK